MEGESDKIALETLAQRLTRDLPAEGISIRAMGGASAFGEHLTDLVGDGHPPVRFGGLCDQGEVDDLRRGMRQAGLGSDLTREEMEALGFYVCVEDLEDELIRAIGAGNAEAVIDAAGDLSSFRSLQNQPFWRGRDLTEQLRRFLSAGAGRKLRYARLLADALDLARIPRPLLGVLGESTGED